jgi:hypothetical protein
MSSFFDFLYIAVLILTWIIAGGFVTNANVKLAPLRYDSNLNTAYWLTFSGAFITWTLIGLTIIGIIYLIILIILGVAVVTVGTGVLFATGVGEVGVAGAGVAAAGVAGTEAVGAAGVGVAGAEAAAVGVAGAEAASAGVAGAEAASAGVEAAETAKEVKTASKEAETLQKEETELSRARQQAQQRKQRKEDKNKDKPKSKAELEREARETPEQRQERELKEEDRDIIKNEGPSWIISGFLLLALGLVVTTGILSAIAASNINQSPYYQQNKDNKSLNKAYSDCVTGAIICLVAAGLLVIGFIIYYVVREKRKRDIEKAIKAEQAAREQEARDREQKLQEIRQAKLQAKVQQDAARKAELERRRSELEEAQHQAMLARVYQQAGVINPPAGPMIPVPPEIGIPPPAPRQTVAQPLTQPMVQTMAQPTEEQCYLNLGLKKGAKKKDVLSTYQNLLNEYNPNTCVQPCCGPNFRLIKDSKDKIISGKTKTGCLPIVSCAIP